MPKTPKEKPLCDPVVPAEIEKEDSWEKDQEKRGYYYDDSYGYETYNPDEDQNEENKSDTNV